jgi:hypothetical protein
MAFVCFAKFPQCKTKRHGKARQIEIRTGGPQAEVRLARFHLHQIDETDATSQRDWLSGVIGNQ